LRGQLRGGEGVGRKGKEKGERKGSGGEGKGEGMWRGPESGLPRSLRWLSAGLITIAMRMTTTTGRKITTQLSAI